MVKCRRIIMLAILVGMVALLHPMAWGAAPDLPPGVDQTAQQMLQLLDQGKFAESFALTAPMIKGIETPDTWYGRLVSERESMGEVNSREMVGAENVTHFGDLPKGDYLLVTFKTVFSTHPEAEEEIVFAKTDQGDYKVVGYRTDYNRWPEATKIIVNGLFLVFFIMVLLAVITWLIGKVVVSMEKSRKAAGAKKEG